jgi:hypothetical protein
MKSYYNSSAAPRYKVALLFFILFISYSSLSGQVPVFQKSFYSGTMYPGGDFLLKTLDGGAIITLHTDSLNASGMLKIDSMGNLDWLKWFDYPDTTIIAGANFILQLDDSGYFSSGGYAESWNPSTISAPMITREDKNGNNMWSKYYYSPNWADTLRVFSSIKKLNNQNYIILGYQCLALPPYSCFPLLVMSDSVGNLQWAKSFYHPSFDTSFSWTDMIITKENKIVFAGNYGYNGEGYAMLAQCDSLGIVEWAKAYVDTFLGPAGIECVAQTPDGGFIMCGLNGGLYLMRTDSSGNLIWSRVYYNGGSTMAYEVEVTPDGGFIVSGRANPQGATYDRMYLLKLDSAGNVEWSKHYLFGVAGSVELTNDGGYLIKDVWTNFMVKTDSTGYAGCETYDITPLTGYVSLQVSTIPVTIYSDTVVFTATYIFSGGVFDTMQDTVFCYGFSGMEESISVENDFLLFPNPVIDMLQIKSSSHFRNGEIKLYDIHGNRVIKQTVGHDTSINVSKFAAGIYFYHIITNNGILSSGKIIKQ